jgi:hypothetical protein
MLCLVSGDIRSVLSRSVDILMTPGRKAHMHVRPMYVLPYRTCFPHNNALTCTFVRNITPFGNSEPMSRPYSCRAMRGEFNQKRHECQPNAKLRQALSSSSSVAW